MLVLHERSALVPPVERCFDRLVGVEGGVRSDVNAGREDGVDEAQRVADEEPSITCETVDLVGEVAFEPPGTDPPGVAHVVRERFAARHQRLHFPLPFALVQL